MQKNPKTGIEQSPFGRTLPSSLTSGSVVWEASHTKIGSISRRKVAENFIASALQSLGRIEPTPGSDNIALGVNTWVVPYLENALALLSGEGSLDW